MSTTGLLLGAAFGAAGGVAGAKLASWPMVPAVAGGAVAGALLSTIPIDTKQTLTERQRSILNATQQLVIPGVTKFKIPALKTKPAAVATNDQLATIAGACVWKGPPGQLMALSFIALAATGRIGNKDVSTLEARRWIMDRVFVQASIGLPDGGQLRLPGGTFEMTPNAAIVFARNWLLAPHGAVQGKLKSAQVVRVRNMLRVATLVRKGPTPTDMGKKMHGMTYAEWFDRTAIFPSFVWPVIREDERQQYLALIAPYNPGTHWATSDVWLHKMTMAQILILQTDLAIFIQEMMRRRVHKWPLGPAPAPTIDWGSIGLLFLGVAAAAVLAPVTGGGSLAATALIAATGTVAAADAYMESQGKHDETTQTMLDGMTLAG